MQDKTFTRKNTLTIGKQKRKDTSVFRIKNMIKERPKIVVISMFTNSETSSNKYVYLQVNKIMLKEL